MVFLTLKQINEKKNIPKFKITGRVKKNEESKSLQFFPILVREKKTWNNLFSPLNQFNDAYKEFRKKDNFKKKIKKRFLMIFIVCLTDHSGMKNQQKKNTSTKRTAKIPLKI